MELLFVVIIAAGIGAIVRYSIPGRQAYGLGLVPAVAAAVASIVWVVLLWAGFTFDGGWIWVITLVLSGLAAILVALRVPRLRAYADKRMLAELSGVVSSS
jgi:hypothetical protein